MALYFASIIKTFALLCTSSKNLQSYISHLKVLFQSGTSYEDVQAECCMYLGF